jgi:hypothetical protein
LFGHIAFFCSVTSHFFCSATSYFFVRPPHIFCSTISKN